MKFFLPFSLFRKVYVTIIVLVALIFLSTVGYMALEHYTFIEALYMTVITFSTVGYAEVRPLDDAGKVFNMVVIVTNLGTFTFFLAQIASYFLDGEFMRTYKLYKMKNSINELSGHIIVCGFGRNGRGAALIFSNKEREFVVIERGEINKDEVPFKVDYSLQGDATHDELLIEAGINRAEALVTTLAEDADNLFVVLTARELNPNIKIISRASNDSTVKKLKAAGATSVIMPDKIGGAYMASLVLNPDVKQFMDLLAAENSSNFEIAEIVSARTISIGDLNCWAETGATILGMKNSHGEYLMNPAAKTVIHAGNRVIAMGAKEQLSKVRHLLG